jgi:hypothetical protein
MEFYYFDYDCLIKVFKELLEFKKKKNAMFSLRSWAAKLGYKNSSYLSQCLRGERTINSNLLRAFFQSEKLSPQEQEFLTYLFLKHNCKDLAEIPITELELTVKQSLLSHKM